MKRWLMFFVHVFKILRAMFVLSLLRKLTHEETMPLTVYGCTLVMAGDIVILKHANQAIEVGEIIKTMPEADTVHMRVYRRPS